MLDQHALAGPRGSEHHRDLVFGQPEVDPIEDPGAAELFDQVDDLDRVLAAVVALRARKQAVGIGLAGIGPREGEIPAQDRPVLSNVRR